jgi:Flp pilus assembly protein TadD
VLRRAVELSPDNPRALDELARSHLRHGRPQEALGLSARAVQLQPGNAALLDTLAAALSGAGRCAEALRVQRRAVEVLPHDEDEAALRVLTRHLDELSRQCG